VRFGVRNSTVLNSSTQRQAKVESLDDGQEVTQFFTDSVSSYSAV
jgi:hypothetical protein